jgi:hypothetical protein
LAQLIHTIKVPIDQTGVGVKPHTGIKASAAFDNVCYLCLTLNHCTGKQNRDKSALIQPHSMGERFVQKLHSFFVWQ